MKWSKRWVVEFAAIAGMVAVVGTLAVLQYRWTGQISRSQQERLRAMLGTSVRGFDQEFSYDFERLCEGFEIDPEAGSENLEARVIRQQNDWTRTASKPDLLAGVHIWKTNSPRSAFESLEPNGKRFFEMPWPDRLNDLRQLVQFQAQQLNGRELGDREALYYPWTFEAGVPALVRPMFQMDRSANVQLRGFLILEFNRQFVEQEYVPDLVARHFGEPGLTSFAVAVRESGAPYRAIYVSSANFPVSTISPDAQLNLFSSVAEEARRRGHAPVQFANDGEQWQLVVRDPAGSLDVGVAQWRRRNLAVSLGLLAILAGTMVLLFTVARRAERLAKLQLQFVAGVSHELCTPLAVINSAAENIADGIVERPAQVQEYGSMIREQGRRLERLVDEVLLFAAGRFGMAGYDLRPIEIGPALEQSLVTSEAMLRESGFTFVKEISADLPAVIADPDALAKCVENLISNAVKYSTQNRWVSLRAFFASGNHPEVCINVADRGMGISDADLPHVFDPFYRAQDVREGQIRGVGLGLYLVKQMMEAVGGRVSVSSTPGKGSVFTLHFPLTEMPGANHEVAQNTEAAKA